MIAGRTALAACMLLAGCGDAGTGPGSDEPTACAGERVTLAPGETKLLSPADRPCLELPAGRYALAYLDARSIEAARDGDGYAQFPPFRVALGTPAIATDAGAPSAAPRHQATATLPHLHVETRMSDEFCDGRSPEDVYCAPEPWQVDDRFVLRQDGVTRPNGDPAVRVVDVRDRLVLAVDESLLDRFEPTRGLYRALLGEAAEAVVPFLRAVIADAHPATANGQLLIVLRDFPGGPGTPSGQALSVVSGAGARTYITLDLQPHIVSLRSVLVHELAHAWQSLRLGAARRAGHQGTAQTWAIEGGAEFVKLEYFRREAGVEYDDNLDVATPPPSTEPLARYVGVLRSANGTFELGYGHIAGPFRYLAARLPLDEDSVVAELVNGSLGGWFGEGGTPVGLIERLRTLLDPELTPERLLLTYTLATAMDERTSEPALQDLGVRRAWKRSAAAAWVHDGRLHRGGSEQVSTRLRQQGSGGYFYIDVDSATMTVEVAHDAGDALRLMIGRY